MATTIGTYSHPSPVKRALATAASVALVSCVFVGFGPVAPASAAGEILVSSDGNAWGTSMPQDLFLSTATLVPLSSESSTMYVRNVGTEAGYLRIALRDVVVGDQEFADALTVVASVPGYAGLPVPISSAAPCRVLTEGLLVGPGTTVPITVQLALGDLSGSTGQNATAGLNISITLSQGTSTAMQPTQCDPNGTVVVVTQPPGGTPAGGNVAGEPADDTAAGDSEGGEVVIDLPLVPPFTVDANTQQLFEQLIVFGPYVAMVVGSGIFFLVARRRRKNEDDDDLDSDPDGTFADEAETTGTAQ